MKDVKEMSLKEMAAYYNEHAEKPVKRFSDRKNAEKRIKELMEDKMEDFDVIIEDGEMEVEVDDSEEEAVEEKAARRNNSAGIKESWKVPEIREKRTQRSAVEVNGAQYKSVAEAFRELGLPMEKHIKFRGALKAAEEMDGFGMSWKIIPLNY